MLFNSMRSKKVRESKRCNSNRIMATSFLFSRLCNLCAKYRHKKVGSHLKPSNWKKVGYAPVALLYLGTLTNSFIKAKKIASTSVNNKEFIAYPIDGISPKVGITQITWRSDLALCNPIWNTWPWSPARDRGIRTVAASERFLGPQPAIFSSLPSLRSITLKDKLVYRIKPSL